MHSLPTVLVTGISGNLGRRLLPMLAGIRVIGVDIREPDTILPVEFRKLNLGQESSCRELTQLMRETGVRSVVHLAFVVDPDWDSSYDADRMWQTNVAGTARVMEAISVVNRTGGNIRQFIFPSCASVYGPETPGPVNEEFPLMAHTLPCAVHKRESDEIVRYRAESMGDCQTYVLRAHIYAGESVDNYLLRALRGGALGRSSHTRPNPVILPLGKKYSKNFVQFVHVDDMARLIVHLLHRPQSGQQVMVLNVAAPGDPLTLLDCAGIAQSRVRRVPGRALCRSVLKALWKRGSYSLPPEALPYIIGSYTMDTTRLRELLGMEYRTVFRYSIEEALRDSFPK